MYIISRKDHVSGDLKLGKSAKKQGPYIALYHESCFVVYGRYKPFLGFPFGPLGLWAYALGFRAPLKCPEHQSLKLQRP